MRRDDKMIDEMDEDIRAEAARVLALRAPTAGDLRIVLSVMTMSSHLERMGDHATSIAEQTIYLVTGKMPDEDRPKGDTTAYSATGTDAA